LSILGIEKWIKSFNLAPVSDQEYIRQLESTISIQADQILILEKKVEQLLLLLQKAGIKKDSHNSHFPPSKDVFAKKKSLRYLSTRKSGGQPGHQGHTLEMSSTPDVSIDLKSVYCSLCGNKLEDATFILRAKRQVVDIPNIPPPVYTEYSQYSCLCNNCKFEQVVDFPVGVNAPIQYGTSVQAWVSYLSVSHYLPYGRIKSLLNQLVGINLSEGSIQNLLKKAANSLRFVYDRIKAEIFTSLMVGSDETSVKVKGAKHWIWVWQNALNTLIIASANRSYRTIQSVWENGLTDAILVSDRLSAQLKMPSNGNQVCLAHLLRDSIALDEEEKHPFAQQFIDLLTNVFEFKKILIEQNRSCNEKEAPFFENMLNELLAIPISKELYPKTATFQNSMLKCRNFIFPCLYYLEVPPDNNGSERAIRNIKVKQKVSGQFISGQDDFCVIRSVIDTFVKRNLDVLDMLIQSMRVQPE
jgi:transposase